MVPVFDDWRSVPPEWTGGVVALGNFDGVHHGHQALLAHAQEKAVELGAPLLAFTFEPHPRGFFVPDTGPFRLTLAPAKTRLLAEHGVKTVLAQHFDAAFAALPASSFIEDVLVKGLRARHVVCGYDFTFGARRSGNVEMLRAEGRGRGFEVSVLDPVTHEG
jgi:riboflavin kinase/FMN adenylyltransferase